MEFAGCRHEVTVRHRTRPQSAFEACLIGRTELHVADDLLDRLGEHRAAAIAYGDFAAQHGISINAHPAENATTA